MRASNCHSKIVIMHEHFRFPNVYPLKRAPHEQLPSTYRIGQEIITGEKTINWRIFAIIVSSNFHANTSQNANIQAPKVQPVSLKIKISVDQNILESNSLLHSERQERNLLVHLCATTVLPYTILGCEKCNEILSDDVIAGSALAFLLGFHNLQAFSATANQDHSLPQLQFETVLSLALLDPAAGSFSAFSQLMDSCLSWIS